MEKYTKESLAGLSHEELENAVLELQQKLDEAKENSKMYYDCWIQANKNCDIMKGKFEVLGNLLRTWE